MNIRYKEMSVNRPIIIKRGWPGDIEVNSINAYIGEWVVFKLPLEDGNHAELRLPIEFALEDGLVVPTDKMEMSEED